MNLDKRQDVRDLVDQASNSVDYVGRLCEALTDVLDDHEVALDILRDIYLSDGNVMAAELERFLEKEGVV